MGKELAVWRGFFSVQKKSEEKENSTTSPSIVQVFMWEKGEMGTKRAAQTHSGKLPGNQPVYRFGGDLSSEAWQESDPVSGAGFSKGK